MNILRGAALTTGNAYTKPSPLDLYLETYKTMSKSTLYIFLFVQFVWLILLIAFVWRYIQVKKGNHERINDYIEDLYKGDGVYETMLKGVTSYAFFNMIIAILIFAAGLLFPSYQIQLFNTLLFTGNRQYWKQRFGENPNPTFIHRD